MNARVYLNSDFLGQCPNGYAGFTLPMDKLLNYGAENTLTVKLHTNKDSPLVRRRWHLPQCQPLRGRPGPPGSQRCEDHHPGR